MFRFVHNDNLELKCLFSCTHTVKSSWAKRSCDTENLQASKLSIRFIYLMKTPIGIIESILLSISDLSCSSHSLWWILMIIQRKKKNETLILYRSCFSFFKWGKKKQGLQEHFIFPKQKLSTFNNLHAIQNTCPPPQQQTKTAWNVHKSKNLGQTRKIK